MDDIRFLAFSEKIKLAKNEEEALKNHKATYVKECSYCEEVFDMYPTRIEKWVYKIANGTKLHSFCSYHCMVAFEKENKILNKSNCKNRRIIAISEDYSERVFDSIQKASENLFFTPYQIKKSIDNNERIGGILFKYE